MAFTGFSRLRSIIVMPKPSGSDTIRQMANRERVFPRPAMIDVSSVKT